MIKATSNELRRDTASLLDEVLSGETLEVSRNKRPVALVMSPETFAQANRLTVAELASMLGIPVAHVSEHVGRLVEKRGPGKVVAHPGRGVGSNGSAVLTAEAAVALAVGLMARHANG